MMTDVKIELRRGGIRGYYAALVFEYIGREDHQKEC
jgi:hypothetical protein